MNELVSLTQLAGTLVYAKREFLNHNKYSAAEGGDSKVCSLALRFGRGRRAAHSRTRTLALQKLHRICLAEVRTLKARYTLATVKLALSKYRERDPRRRPRSLGLALKKNALRGLTSEHPFREQH
jgi:hypothetical protein